jgi:hypothetical protein
MAELEHIEIERIERDKYRFYHIVSAFDRQRITPDSHLFAPGELLELAAYVEQNRAALEQEAQEDEERDARPWSEDMKDQEQIKREWREYREG